MNRIAILAAAVAASASFVAAVPAAAAEARVEIYYGDLDTSSHAGVTALNQRVKAGVDRACERPDLRNVVANVTWEQCKNAARAQVAEQLARQGMPITAG